MPYIFNLPVALWSINHGTVACKAQVWVHDFMCHECSFYTEAAGLLFVSSFHMDLAAALLY